MINPSFFSDSIMVMALTLMIILVGWIMKE